MKGVCKEMKIIVDAFGGDNAPLEIIKARSGVFNDWLRQKGKLGGQHKIPRLSNKREYIEQILALNE